MRETILIIGAGQAGAQAVATLRAEGFAGAITIIGDEAFPPYQRPPLSKAYLAGSLERERLFLKPDAFYADAKCELILGVGAAAIDRANRQVALGDGRSLPYDRLLLATGTRVRRIAVPGADLPGVHYLRNIADVDRLRPAFRNGLKLAIVGGGYIGLEVAAVAAKHGLQVDVFEALDRVMARAVSPLVSAFYERVHRDAGVRLHLNTGVDAFEGTGRIAAVRAGGVSHAADAVLVGIGVVPNQELAAAAGLACADGIVVDDCARPRIRRFSRQETAPAIAASTGASCGSNPSRTPSTRQNTPRWRCWAGRHPIAKSHGSGRTNMISSCRSRASPGRATGSCCGAIRMHGNSPCSICARVASPPSRRSMPRRNISSGASWSPPMPKSPAERLADPPFP